MKLTTGSGQRIDHPSAHDVEVALEQGGDVVILEIDADNYLQTNFEVVEQRVDGVQYECVEPATPARVRQLFQAYLDQHPPLPALCAWRELDI